MLYNVNQILQTYKTVIARKKKRNYKGKYTIHMQTACHDQFLIMYIEEYTCEL